MDTKWLVAALSLMGISSAQAADLPVAAFPVKAPAAAAPFSWTGFYVGGQAGGGVLHDAGWVPAAQQISADRDGVGALAGGQIGYNYQMGMLVLGVEGEGFWSGISDKADYYGNASNISYATAQIRNHWDADIAGRFGVAFDRALVFGKAGWVWGGFNWNYSAPVTSLGGTPLPTYTETANATLGGILIGVGLEYAFAPHWSTKFEYDYLGFQSQDVAFTRAGGSLPASPNNFYRQSVSANKNIFKFGVNYLFN